MDFTTAIRTVLRRYAKFSGRARRSEHWWFFLLTFLISVAATAMDAALFATSADTTGPVGWVTAVPLFLPSLAVLVRRLHDVDHSAWFLLILLIPVAGVIILLVVLVRDSDGDNRYGPSPKYPRPPRPGWHTPLPSEVPSHPVGPSAP